MAANVKRCFYKRENVAYVLEEHGRIRGRNKEMI